MSENDPVVNQQGDLGAGESLHTPLHASHYTDGRATRNT